MAMNVGAMPWDSGAVATHADQRRLGRFAPRELTDRSNRLSYVYGVMLNRKGKRFVDEGEDGALFILCQVRPRDPGRARRQGLADFSTPASSICSRPRYQTSKPITAKPRWKTSLTSSTSTTSAGLKTIDEYNAHAREMGTRFDPTKKDGLSSKGLISKKTNWALPSPSRRSTAYSATGGITFTFGGLKVNETAQVIGTDWRPIRACSAAARWSAPVLRQLSGRHRFGLGRNVRADRRT